MRGSLAAAALLALVAAPAGAQPPPDEGRCWVAVRVTGPESMRISEEEARQRLHAQCRAGDVAVFLTDTGQPLGPVAAAYCDMSRPVLIERAADWRSPAAEAHAANLPPAAILTCTYRGGPRVER